MSQPRLPTLVIALALAVLGGTAVDAVLNLGDTFLGDICDPLDVDVLEFDAIGGTVHAFPFSQQIFFAADPTGYSELSVPWPSGVPGGIDVYLQFVVQDLGVPAGLTLSNATVQTTP